MATATVTATAKEVETGTKAVEETSVDAQESGDLMANYKFKRGGNWTQDNVHTILQWIHICSINLDVMCAATFHYKKLIRRNTILSLLMSTITSTASFTQFNINEQSYPSLSTAIKIIITVMATIIAISSGFIKIYQIQEKLEKAIKLQQEWTSFGSILSSELQLPINLRKDALYLIIKYKDIYTELFKQQADVSRKIIAKVAENNNLEPNDLSLSELFERIIYSEADRLSINMDGKDILYKTNKLATASKRITNEIATANEPQEVINVKELKEKAKTELNKALQEINENKSIGQEACNTIETSHVIEQQQEQERQEQERQEQEQQQDNSIVSMSGVIIQKPETKPQQQQQTTAVNVSKKQSFIQTKAIINAKDKLKTIIAPTPVNNNPQQEQNRKRMSNLVVNSSIRK